MYLSQVEIDIQNRQKIRELSHLGAFHHWVEQSSRLKRTMRFERVNYGGLIS